MAKINWMEKLQSLPGAVIRVPGESVHDNVIKTPSPSLNFIYGNGWGLPLGYSLVLYGLPKSGKSVVSYMMAGQCIKDYEDGYVIKFNTEFREKGQLTEEMAAIYGIDFKRYIGIDANHPAEIYDTIEEKLDAWAKDGMKIRMVIIDSMNGVQGRRATDADGGIMKQQIGDVALTNKEGLKRVLAVQRRHNFALIMTSHVAIEMDPIEQKRGNKYKMGASIGVQHHAEYFAFVEHGLNKADRQDMLEQEFTDETKKDVAGKAEKTAHKIKVTMKNSSMGPKGRVAVFTFNYGSGVINQYEEVYLLGVNRGIIKKPNNQTYQFGDKSWRGEGATLKALRDHPELQEEIIKELKRQDKAGNLITYDQADEAANATPDFAQEER